jgi:hypothetical protein
MPHRRIVKKGSFGDHFDELVKHFPEDHDQLNREREQSEGETKSIHDRLFEKSWQAARKQS